MNYFKINQFRHLDILTHAKLIILKMAWIIAFKHNLKMMRNVRCAMMDIIQMHSDYVLSVLLRIACNVYQIKETNAKLASRDSSIMTIFVKVYFKLSDH